VTATDIARAYQEINPQDRFATLRDGSAVGIWVPEQNRFVEFYLRTLISGTQIPTAEPSRRVANRSWGLIS
jgi:hypothetical protein